MTGSREGEPTAEDRLLGIIYGQAPEEVARIRTATPLPPSTKAKRLLRDEVKSVLGRLTEQESKILALRFGLQTGESLTQSQTGL